jgi:hypothetical protein
MSSLKTRQIIFVVCASIIAIWAMWPKPIKHLGEPTGVRYIPASSSYDEDTHTHTHYDERYQLEYMPEYEDGTFGVVYYNCSRFEYEEYLKKEK